MAPPAILRFLHLALAIGANLQGALTHEVLPATKQASDRLVFAHFMIGTSSNRRNISDYDEDMRRAKSLGIDAFALNIGVDKDTTQQLELAYASAEKHSMKVFISFDFNWWQTDQAVEIGEMIARFAPRPAQLIVDNKVFASTFAGDGLDVSALRAAVGTTLFFAPNFDPGLDLNVSSVEGLFNWQAWPHNGRNKAPTAHSNISVGEGDQLYINTLAGRAYIAREYSNPPAPGRFDVPCADRPKAVSPWFFTHFGPEVSYSKNWIFPADLLWYDRWREILAMQPRFVEIVTWNDYGESHYTGSLHAPHTDNGASKPHDGWATMAQPFIAAFKAGASSPDDYITKSDRLIYWYRPTLRGQDCDSTDTCMVKANNRSGDYFLGRPDGWQSVRDSVFVVSLLHSPASIQISSGGSLYQYAAPAGASSHEAPMSPGEQSFSVSRDGTTILAGASLKPIIDGCVCGLYNFNAYVGTLPPSTLDPLQADGLASFSQGLQVQTCRPTPSLMALGRTNSASLAPPVWTDLDGSS